MTALVFMKADRPPVGLTTYAHETNKTYFCMTAENRVEVVGRNEKRPPGRALDYVYAL